MGTEIGLGGLMLVSAVSALINGGIELATSKKNYDDSVSLWNMNNAYNSPTQQMKRLKDAGLNPNLVYGNGSVVGNTSHQPSNPGMTAPHFSIDLQNLLLSAQEKKLEQDAAARKQSIETQKIRNKIFGLQFEELKNKTDMAKRLGLPAGSPWYVMYLMDNIDKFRPYLERGGYGFGDLLYTLMTTPADTESLVENTKKAQREANIDSVFYDTDADARNNGQVFGRYE